ncbi:MAG: hypothetical protein PWQ72_999 [Pseudothermotoga sp.]|jgi:uncharacterized membrane protein|nr:MAG: hypothetical protein XD56_0208 [Pseudothermotoga lettingae]MDI3494872.1 hypothetical protein [Pseudothermotoga sp.]
MFFFNLKKMNIFDLYKGIVVFIERGFKPLLFCKKCEVSDIESL